MKNVLLRKGLTLAAFLCTLAGLTQAQTISGYILRENGAPVPGVLVELSGGGIQQTQMTGADGSYSFGPIPAGEDYTVTPFKNDGAAECVTVLDLVKIVRHILGIESLPSPYAIISADANANNGVTTLDLVYVRNVILGISSSFPNNTTWRFVPADFAFVNPSNPFSQPIPHSAQIQSLAGDVQADFIAMKTGDVTDCLETLGAPFLTLSVPDVTAEEGEAISIGISVVGFTQVAGFQFSLHWDPAVLSFNGANSFILPGFTQSNVESPASGIATFAFIADNPATGETVPNGIIGLLSFTVVGNEGDMSALAFSQNPTPFEVVKGSGNGNLTVHTLSHVDGSVTVTPPMVHLSATHVNSSAAETPCLDVIAGKNFSGIQSIQFSMQYDPAIIEFSHVQDFGLIDLDANNFTLAGPGVLTVNWAFPGGESVGHGAVLFRLCFTPVACGQTSHFDFTSTPVAAEFQLANGDIIPHIFFSGSVFIDNVWYKDADNDGWSDGATLVQCAQPAGYRLAPGLQGLSGDCDDNNPSVYPGAPEVCNGIDDNCDGQIDEGVIQLYGVNTTIDFCATGAGTATVFLGGNPGNYDILWSDGQTTQTATGLSAGLYSVTVSVQGGCSKVASGEVGAWLQPPNANCKTPFPVDILPAGTIQITPDDINAGSNDACGPVSLSISLNGTNFGPFVELSCQDVGGMYLYLGVENGLGFFSSCQTYIALNIPETWYLDADGDGYGDLAVTATGCPAPAGYVGNSDDCDDSDPNIFPGQFCSLSILGNIRTENGQGIAGATVWLNGQVSLSTFSDESGRYSFEDIPNGSYEVCPELNVNPLNGITTFDAVLVNRHIVGDQILGSPYKIIAADVVGDGSIADPAPDVADLIVSRQLIIQIISEFPNGVPSWVFLPADHTFPDPANPWHPASPPSCKTVIVADYNVDGVDFIGVKKGDVNNSAAPN